MMLYRKFRAMNTDILLGAECLDPEPVFEMAKDLVRHYEDRFSRFKESSELCALNRSAGEWFAVSPEMLELLIAAMACHHATNGIFDPSILPDLQAAGYTQSFDQLRKLAPSTDTTDDSPRAHIRFSEVEIDSLRGRVRLPKGMQLDFGGIAKGWIAEKTARQMALSCTACAVNAGGDMFIIGQPQGQTAWEVGLEDPQNPIMNLMVLQVKDGALATSSVMKRTWQRGEKRMHHLIDPRTGEPAKTPWLSVTVFAPAAVSAETFAKALLIAGPEQAQPILDNDPAVTFIAIDAQRQLWKSPTEVEKLYDYTQ